MQLQKEITEQILSCYFDKSLSSQEAAEVEKWISLSDENKKIAEDVYFIYLATDNLEKIKKIDVRTDFEEVKKKIDSRKSKKLFLQWFQRIAAIILLPLLITTVYYIQRTDYVESVELRTNPGMTSCIRLPDGTRVWLNSGSYLKYPTRFDTESRLVELQGEGYFEVEKEKKRNFIVKTPQGVEVEVLGTEFNLEAYNGASTVKTMLVSGSIRFTFENDRKQVESVLLKPGEEITYNALNRNISLNTPFAPTLTAWKDGLVIFRNTTFEHVLSILSKRFNVDFIVKNQKLYDNNFTGTFEAQHLPGILQHFCISTGIQYRIIEPQKDQIMEKMIIELY